MSKHSKCIISVKGYLSEKYSFRNCDINLKCGMLRRFTRSYSDLEGTGGMRAENINQDEDISITIIKGRLDTIHSYLFHQQERANRQQIRRDYRKMYVDRSIIDKKTNHDFVKDIKSMKFDTGIRKIINDAVLDIFMKHQISQEIFEKAPEDTIKLVESQTNIDQMKSKQIYDAISKHINTKSIEKNGTKKIKDKNMFRVYGGMNCDEWLIKETPPTLYNMTDVVTKNNTIVYKKNYFIFIGKMIQKIKKRVEFYYWAITLKQVLHYVGIKTNDILYRGLTSPLL